MNWRVRRAGADDSDALSLVANAAFLESYATGITGTDLVAHCLTNNTPATFATWTNDPAFVVTLGELEPGHVAVGYAVLTPPDFPIVLKLGDMELRRIYTLTQMHGSGMGRALLSRAIADARDMGGKRLLLGVWEHNARARAFYERHGFSVIGARPFRVGGEIHDDPVYALDL